jgi:hypothetical protein
MERTSSSKEAARGTRQSISPEQAAVRLLKRLKPKTSKAKT